MEHRSALTALTHQKPFFCHPTSSLSTGAATHLSISIETVGKTPQSVELSFNSSILDNPFSLREIMVAPDLMYKLVCTRRGNRQFDGNSWFRESGAAVTQDASQRIYAQSPNRYTWILVFTNFDNRDTGRYSCSNSGEMLSLIILTGKWLIMYRLHTEGEVCIILIL